ncbi:unnamed protein product [Polarella glacialis]|uniref:Uncharacterized protein n=1 Tax=Polarella glacialis TaxID=89957 RepID=A0A813FN57_POLGL|nr:unnamed protein product [Polarella glacialis]
MPPWAIWTLQTGIWLTIMSFVKLSVSVGVYFGQDEVYSCLASTFRMLGLCGHHRAQLLASVVVIPVVGDAFQFAVQDTFLKNKPAAATVADAKEHSLECLRQQESDVHSDSSD